jgi:hypothetical protein
MNDDAINDKATALVARIAKHWPDLDLDQYVTKWFELDDERVVLQVDYGAAMFELVGDDLHAVGPVPVDLDGRDPEETIPDEHGRPFPALGPRCRALSGGRTAASTSPPSRMTRSRQWRTRRSATRGPMHVHQRRAFESADYGGWRIGLRPIVSPPCRCERPVWWRDEFGIRCAKCGQRRRSRGDDDERPRRAARQKRSRIGLGAGHAELAEQRARSLCHRTHDHRSLTRW